MAEPSYLTLATNLFTAPSEAFVSLKERPRVLLPVLLLVAVFSASQFYYMSHVDMGWLLESQLQAAGAAVPAAQREQVVASAAKVPPVVYGAIGAVTTNFILFLVFTIVSLYYTLVSFLSKDGVKLKQWFVLLCWCALPQVLGQIAALVNMSI
ncbi:MAG TPA: YIP1 family protein, partial [Gammaproteobacteria bacterium]|nr:YIP1 family protein [Gammaproteobacteria bacterium]